MPSDAYRVMDLLLYFWITLMGIIPPTICSAAVGYILYQMGLKRGREEKEQAKAEIKQEISRYVKEELVQDLVGAVSDAVIKGVRGAFGPVGRGGSEETQAYLAEEAQRNPGLVAVLGKIATRGGARWLGKQAGLSRSVVDAIVAGSGGGGLPFTLPKRQKEDLTFDVHGPQVP